MRNPNIQRAISFLILFGGFGIMAVGGVLVPIGWVRYLLLGVGIVMVVISVIYSIKNVRCPHCRRLLSLRIAYTVTCPYCHKRVDE